MVGEILGAAFNWGPKDSATQWVSFSTGVSAPAAPTVVNEIAVELVARGFTSPLAYVSPQDGTGRMFVVDQIGLIRVVEQNGNVQTEPFLDLRDRMVSLRPGFDERGLLGMAFHPDFSSNGRFFVHYSAPPSAGGPSGWDHTAIISEFRVSETNANPADPASENILMHIDQPQFNHNGGHIAFGPDGVVFAANQVNGVWRFRELAVSNRSGQRIGAYITGMGQDDNHELYVLTTASAGPAGNTGQVFRIISPDGLQDRMD